MIAGPEAPARDDVARNLVDTSGADVASTHAAMTDSQRGAAPRCRAATRLPHAIRSLFVEARRRRRRRRAAFAFLSAALVAAVAIGYGVTGGFRDRATAGREHSAPVIPPQPSFDLPPAAVAWFDAEGQLRIGDVASLAQRAVASVGNGNEPCCVTVAAGGRMYWANVLSGRSVVQDYDFATGKIRTVTAGWAVFPSGSRRAVYIAQSRSRLLEVSVAGTSAARRLTTPPGWHVVPLPWAVAGGVAVSRGGRIGEGPNPVIGIWHLRSAHVEIIGHGQVLATVTPGAGAYSLIAWQPDGCGLQHCPLKITDTASDATLTVSSPLRYGFLNAGEDVVFSRDGSELVGFVSLNAINPSQAALFVPALVSTRTGAVRVLRNAVLENDELGGWAVWLPDGRLLAGPSANPNYPAYAIDARTGAVRPFTFSPSEGAPADISYGAVLLPRTDVQRPRQQR